MHNLSARISSIHSHSFTMTTRPFTHAGSWYSSDPLTLSTEITDWLSQVANSIKKVTLPVSDARVIIAPHAGYSYSGAAAAFAYAALSLTSNIRRIFLLGPSHVWYLNKCALSTHTHYATPTGTLPIDTLTVAALRATGKFVNLPPEIDEREHSLEMHLPYIFHLVSRTFKSVAQYPALVPILVGNTNAATEVQYGRILAPYLADSTNLFIISSDFCHWGLRFGYTYYLPEGKKENEGHDLKMHDSNPTNPAIHESIAKLDKAVMDAIETGSHSAFLRNLKTTGNTVCGRHPIGIILAALETLEIQSKEVIGESEVSDPDIQVDSSQTANKKYKFKFLRYERSSEVVDVSDSSVSYASAYATLGE
ncbi:Protein MEMO1-like protein [Golovinomyces cichoracearum]|uniref:Protein MEMO1-like protein n=1 Tax=Golovinomyces cichoracearum TaxID=62708 RepID=A0A420ISQ7_9PEZI|nr:Protein MEMO1-like protein [Golovinomyces cichoracearum]